MGDELNVLPAVGEMAVIKQGELRLGDVLVLSCSGGLTDAGYRRMSAAAAELGITLLILDGGLEITAILHKGE